MKYAISFFASSIFVLHKYIASSDFSPSGLASQVGGTLKWGSSLSLSRAHSITLSPFFDPALSFDKTCLSFLRFLVDFCVSLPRRFTLAAYRAPSYREVHNPEGLITYSSGERESRYRATHRLISPTPRALPRTGGELVHPLPRTVLPLRSNSIYP